MLSVKTWKYWHEPSLAFQKKKSLFGHEPIVQASKQSKHMLKPIINLPAKITNPVSQPGFPADLHL